MAVIVDQTLGESSIEPEIAAPATKSLNPDMTYFYRITLNDGTCVDFRFGMK